MGHAISHVIRTVGLYRLTVSAPGVGDAIYLYRNRVRLVSGNDTLLWTGTLEDGDLIEARGEESAPHLSVSLET